MEILIYTNYEAEYVTTVKPEQLWRKIRSNDSIICNIWSWEISNI